MIVQPGCMPEDFLASYKGLKIVRDFNELAAAQYNPANAIVLPRRLSADFKSLAERMVIGAGKDKIFMEEKGCFELSGDDVLDYFSEISGVLKTQQEKQAAEIIASDISKLKKVNFDTIRLRFIAGNRYFGGASVGAFHGDGLISGEQPFERVLSCYTGAATDFVCNDKAVSDNEGYFSVKRKDVLHFENGDIWRHISFNILGIPPFVHRSPKPDGELRMLLAAQRSLAGLEIP